MPCPLYPTAKKQNKTKTMGLGGKWQTIEPGEKETEFKSKGQTNKK